MGEAASRQREKRPGLVVTRISVPAPPHSLTERPRLAELLLRSIQHKLTVIVAPAGFGKTVLASTVLSSKKSGRSVGWVSIDAGHNDPMRFWSTVMAALLSAGLRPAADDGLFAPADHQAPEAVAADLIDAIGADDRDLLLVLDDYHVITAPVIHETLALLLDALPLRLRLVILSRSEPPFLSARLKAHGDVAELRARDLRFSSNETTAFLHDQGVTSVKGVGQALCERVGGWPVALRLVCLWAQRRDDPPAAVSEYAADDAIIAEYLVSEVLGDLPHELCQFLLWTSILPRLSGALCDAVTGQTSGTDMLIEIDRRDLFIGAVDPERVWFRSHQLFAEILRSELRRAYPEMLDELHRRASVWFAANGCPDEAIDHGLLAGDWPRVRMLLLNEALAIGSNRSPSVVDNWLQRIPADVFEASPFVRVLRGLAAAYTGRIGIGRAEYQAARRIGQTPGSAFELPELPALLDALEVCLDRLDCDLLSARRLAADVEIQLGLLPDDQTPLAVLARVVTAAALSGTMLWHGETDDAERILRQTEQTATTHAMERVRLNCISSLALIRAASGRLREADALTAEAMGLAEPLGVVTHFQMNDARLAGAIVALQRGDHERAEALLRAVTELARQHGDRAPLVAAGVLSSRLAFRRADLDGAFATLDEARTTYPRWQLPTALEASVYEIEARTCLLGGDVGGARTLLGDLENLSTDVPAAVFATELTAARLLVVDGAGGNAAPRFEAVAQVAAMHDRLSLRVEALVGAAVARWSVGQTQEAVASLNAALMLARDETILGPFIMEAHAMRPLLLRIEQSAGESAAVGFRQQVLRALGVPPRLLAQHRRRTSAHDKLSERELAVLRLLRGSLSNAEIAAALSVTPNTLKTHIRHIYQKLGAQSRDHAVDRARELDLPH